jgi:pimeloyl-ACP methyl ester carboxylesterase
MREEPTMAKQIADWRSEALGPARTLELDGGRMRVHVTEADPAQPAIVFVHGALVNANLWRKVVPLLDGFTRVTLDLPLGSHLIPMPARPLTPPDAAA